MYGVHQIDLLTFLIVKNAEENYLAKEAKLGEMTINF